MSTAARITRKPKSGENGRLPPAIPPLPVRRFTVEEYHKLCEIGVITPNDRVELIHGWIVAKMGINPPHDYAVTALMEQLLALGASATVRVQQPITTADSEPEPDVVFAVGSKADYKTRQPKPAECIIVAEVADSSPHEDQTTKLTLYAGAKVAVYWIVNLVDRRVEVYTQPKGGKAPAYKTRTDCGLDGAVPVVIGGRRVGTIAAKELLP
jgi:Uma2 family endonuclease